MAININFGYRKNKHCYLEVISVSLREQ